MSRLRVTLNDLFWNTNGLIYQTVPLRITSFVGQGIQFEDAPMRWHQVLRNVTEEAIKKYSK